MVYLRHLTHFFHQKIGAYCGRPDGWQELILENMKCIGPEDVLFHLGDVAFRYNRQEVAKLVATFPGATRILIEGNHDKRSKVRREPIWSEVYREGKVYTLTALRESPSERSWTSIVMVHNPEDFPLLVLEDGRINILLHGHVHEKGMPWKWDDLGRLWMNLSVEQWAYKPVELETILEIYREKRPCP